MKKFECNRGDCRFRPCRVEVADTCPMLGLSCMARAVVDPSDWKEVNPSEAERQQWGLHVFDLPDCPEWAQWAALDNTGVGYWYAVEPTAYFSVWHRGSREAKFLRIGTGHFGGVLWGESLLERPTRLKERQWVRYAGDQYGQFVRKDADGLYVIDTIAGNITTKDAIPLEVTPWSDKQLRETVGKVIVGRHDSAIVTGIVEGSRGNCPILMAVFGDHAHAADSLTSWVYLCGGKPCGNIKEL